MYWELVDQVIEIDSECASLFEQHQRPGQWDRDKLQALAGVLRYLGHTCSVLRVFVEGSSHEPMRAYVSAAAQALGVAVQYIDAPGLEVDLHIDLLSRAAPLPIAKLETDVRRLSLGGVYYLSHWDDVSREDSILSRERLRALMRAHGALPLFESYYAAFQKLDTTAFEAERRLAAQVPRPVEGVPDRIIFVVGHARSGTSVLSQLLNDQPDVFLLYEANSYLVKNRHEFSANFNARAERLHRKRSKGFFVPRTLGPDTLANTYENLLKHYHFVGEKLAFGPRLNAGHAHHSSLAFDFHAAHFPFARYVLVARAPMAAVAAIAKIMPDFSTQQILEGWVASLHALLLYALNFPSTRFIAFEHVVAGEFDAVAELLGQPVAPGLLQVDKEEVSTAAEHTTAYWQTAGDPSTRDVANQAEEVYRSFCSLFDQTGTWAPGVNNRRIDRELSALNTLMNRASALRGPGHTP